MAATHLVMNTAALKRVLWLRRKSRVVISSCRVPQIEHKEAQERMNRLLGVSGYGLGLAAMVAALALCILWIGGHWEFFTAHSFQTAGLGVAACLFAGGAGRTIGLLYARWRLAQLIWQVAAQMDHQMDHRGSNVQGIAAQRVALLRRKPIVQ